MVVLMSVTFFSDGVRECSFIIGGGDGLKMGGLRKIDFV